MIRKLVALNRKFRIQKPSSNTIPAAQRRKNLKLEKSLIFADSQI